MRETVNMEPVTLEGVLAKEKLHAAWLQVKANNGAAGVDGLDVERSSAPIRERWGQIEAALLAGRCRPAAVRAVDIPKASGGVRTLGIPTVLDKELEKRGVSFVRYADDIAIFVSSARSAMRAKA